MNDQPDKPIQDCQTLTELIQSTSYNCTCGRCEAVRYLAQDVIKNFQASGVPRNPKEFVKYLEIIFYTAFKLGYQEANSDLPHSLLLAAVMDRQAKAQKEKDDAHTKPH